MSNKEIELIKNESLGQKLIKKGFWLYFFGYLSAPLRYVIRVIISNSPDVSVSEFGVLYSIISLITLLYTYNDLGLTESLQYFLPRFYLRKQFDNIKATVYLSLFVEIVTGLIISLGLRFGSDWLAVHYFESEIASVILKYFCFYFILTNLLQIIQTIFIAFQKTFEYQFVEFIKVLSIALFTIGFFFVDKGNIEFYGIARLLGLVVAIIVAIFLYKKYRSSIIKGQLKRGGKVLKEYVKYAMWAFAGISIRNLFDQIILQLVVYMLGVEDAGYYSNFLSLFSIGIAILWPIRSLLYPLTSEYNENENTQGIEKLISIFYNYFSVIVLSFSILLMVLGPEISAVFFGEKYLLSGVLLSYAGIFLLFRLLASFNFQILAGLGKVKERVLVLGITCLLTIAISIVGIKIWGIYGAAVTFGIGNIIYWILSFYLLKKEKFKFKLNLNFLVKNIILLFVLGFLIYFTKNYVFQYGCSRWIILLGLADILVVSCCIIGLFNKNELMKIRLKNNKNYSI